MIPRGIGENGTLYSLIFLSDLTLHIYKKNCCERNYKERATIKKATHSQMLVTMNNEIGL